MAGEAPTSHLTDILMPDTKNRDIPGFVSSLLEHGVVCQACLMGSSSLRVIGDPSLNTSRAHYIHLRANAYAECMNTSTSPVTD